MCIVAPGITCFYASHKIVCFISAVNKCFINIADCCPADLPATQQMVYFFALWYSLNKIQSPHAHIVWLWIFTLYYHKVIHLFIQTPIPTHTCRPCNALWSGCVQLLPLIDDGSLWDAAKLFYKRPQNVIVAKMCRHTDTCPVPCGAGMVWKTTDFPYYNTPFLCYGLNVVVCLTEHLWYA